MNIFCLMEKNFLKNAQCFPYQMNLDERVSVVKFYDLPNLVLTCKQFLRIVSDPYYNRSITFTIENMLNKTTRFEMCP